MVDACKQVYTRHARGEQKSLKLNFFFVIKEEEEENLDVVDWKFSLKKS